MKSIRFVDVGEGITEGHLRKWLVPDGSQVKEDQSLVQVETDKAVVSVPAPIDGTIKIIAKDGTTLHVGDTLAYIGTPQELAGVSQQRPAASQQPAAGTVPQGAKPAPSTPAQDFLKSIQSIPKPAPAPKPQPPAPPAPTPPVTQKRDILATPSVRKLAHELGIDLSQVKGTGPAGRILESDLRAPSGQHAPQAPPQKPAPQTAPAAQQPAGMTERIPLTQTRKAIARNMEASRSIPVAVSMDLVDAQALYDIVHREKEKVQAEKSVHLTFLPFMIKAAVEALKENPNFNASYDADSQEIIRKKYFNIGLAAEAQDGLKVVVIKNADKKNLLEIASEIQALHKKLTDNTITLDEMRDTSFTITNVGSLGGGFLSVPIINHPDVAILGVHMIADMPVARDGKVVVRKTLPISLVFDHRVVDGADAVKFSNTFKQCIEDVDFLEMLG